MLAAMANTAVHAVPASMARHLPFVLGLVSMPLSLLFDPDSFYLGALPIVAQVGSTLGVPPIQIAQAALLGQMTTGFPISPLTPATFLVVGLDRHRARRAPAIHRSLPVRRIRRHDDRLRRCSECFRYEDRADWQRRRVRRRSHRAGGRARRRTASLDYLVFECLAERTIALAQEARAKDPSRGFDPMLERRLEAVLPACREQGVTIVTNMGAANPASAGARRAGAGASPRLPGPDDRDGVGRRRLRRGDGGRLHDRRNRSAGFGAEGSTDLGQCLYRRGADRARRWPQGAQLVITGRAADPSLFVAPLAHSLGWRLDAWPSSGGARWWGTCSNVRGRSPADTSRIPAARTSPVWSGSDFRSPRCRNEGPIVITKVSGSGGRGHRGHLQGTAALRDPRSLGVHHA